MSCPSCQALLQLGLSLSVQAQRLDAPFPDRAARPSRCATPAFARAATQAERHADYDRRLAAWQESVREHLAQHQGGAQL